jgi:hypothetical protein
MMINNQRFRITIAGLAAATVIVASCGGDDAATDTAAPTTEPMTTEPMTTEPMTTEPMTTEPMTTEPMTMFEGELTGLMGVAAGLCDVAGEETGSFFRMVQIGGTLADGPYMPNADSPCADQTFTPLTPGSDGGLLLGEVQAAPDPAFDEGGNALADRIAMPVAFFGPAFAMATADDADAPSATATDGVLTARVPSVVAFYAGEAFNQGAPKPDGSTPGLTSEQATGTIAPVSGAYILEWASQVVGGPFNEFTGVWHLEGVVMSS